MGSWIEWEIKIEGKRSREENILDSKMRESRGVEGGISKWADLGSGLSLAGGRLTSSCPCPLSTLELMWWNLVERNLWNSLEEKKKKLLVSVRVWMFKGTRSAVGLREVGRTDWRWEIYRQCISWGLSLSSTNSQHHHLYLLSPRAMAQ